MHQQFTKMFERCNPVILALCIVLSTAAFSADSTRLQNKVHSVLINQLFFLQYYDALFLTDSAGPTFLNVSFAERQGWDIKTIASGGQPLLVTQPDAGFSIPLPFLNEGNFTVRNGNPVPPHLEYINSPVGILGHIWFANRSVFLNYREGEIHFEEISDTDGFSETPIHFHTERGFYFPRIELEISGKKYSMLLQTGGYVVLSDRFSQDFPYPWIPAGYISESVFSQWKAEHPDWLILQNGDRFYGSDIIRAEEITIAGLTLPFAWFAVRRDEVYRDHFSQWTDQPVQGALGPDVFSGKEVHFDGKNQLLRIR